MKMDDMVLVSIDDHVIEPPDAFVPHMPTKFKSRTPFVENMDGVDCWNVDGRRFFLGGLNAVAGRPRDEYGVEPAAFSHLRRSSFDLAARLDDMNANGVLASMCFPSVMGFGGGMPGEFQDREYALALVRAYNDWHVHDWAGGKGRGRFIPLGILPMWDIDLAVEEAKRLAGLGVHAVAIPDNPAFKGTLPSIHTGHWDPLWKVCADNAVILCTHIGSGASPPFTTLDQEATGWMATIGMATALPAVDWLFSPIWKKFPTLKLALSEANIGWIPHLLERSDFAYEHHRAWTKSDFGNELPSDVFRRHFIVCFIDDKYGIKNRHELGLQNITWECDFPHSDCTWPHSPETLWESVKGIPDNEIDMITHLNAIREFNFDPIGALGRENFTVAALRKAAAHIDTSPTRGLGGVKPVGARGPVTIGEIQGAFAKQKKGVAA